MCAKAWHLTSSVAQFSSHGDDDMTKPGKSRGRKPSGDEASARLADFLYNQLDKTGKECAEQMGKPRTTVLDLARRGRVLREKDEAAKAEKPGSAA